MKTDIPSLKQFENTTRAIFDEVMGAHNFRGPTISCNPPETAVKYENDNLRVTLLYEFGSSPWGVVDMCNKLKKWRSYTIEAIAKTICSDQHLVCPAIGKLTSENMDELIYYWVNVLEAYIRRKEKEEE